AAVSADDRRESLTALDLLQSTMQRAVAEGASAFGDVGRLAEQESQFLNKALEMAGRRLDKSTVRSLMSGLVLISCMTQAFGFDGATTKPVDEESRRAAAVALNYSRAALHHIRQNPSKRVLYEEQEKILNHLNLNGVADEEVLKLYSGVLDEISQIQIADRE